MKYVVDMENFSGHVYTTLDENGCGMWGDNRTAEEFESAGYKIMDETAFMEHLREWEDFNLCNNWQEIKEEQYEEALDCLPPLKWYNGGFYMGECYTSNIYSFYQKWNGKFYTSLQRITTPRSEILEVLQNFIKYNT